ncbi:MAG: methyltransferase domain-containing protein [Patescibacteria group bacterium]
MFADPVKILKQFSIADNMIVADLGAGSGFYSVAAGHIAKNGKVYAVEVQKDFLTTIKIKSIDAGLKNVEIIWGDIEKIGGTKIKDGIIDRVIISNVLFQVSSKHKFLEEAFRILKKSGKILLVDWAAESGIFSPKNNVVIEKKKAREMLEEKSFVFERDIDAGEYHYGMIFKKD